RGGARGGRGSSHEHVTGTWTDRGGVAARSEGDEGAARAAAAANEETRGTHRQALEGEGGDRGASRGRASAHAPRGNHGGAAATRRARERKSHARDSAEPGGGEQDVPVAIQSGDRARSRQCLFVPGDRRRQF